VDDAFYVILHFGGLRGGYRRHFSHGVGGTRSNLACLGDGICGLSLYALDGIRKTSAKNLLSKLDK
jgi:hypothetical protein